MSDDPTTPSRSGKDIAVAFTKAAVAGIPYAGGPLVELLNLLLKPTLDARRDAFLSDLSSRLQVLEHEGHIRRADLQQNEPFADIVLQASLAALRTRSQSKRDALRNAVLNAVLPSAPEIDLQELFIGFVDAFFPWHLAILGRLAQDPGDEQPNHYAASRVTLSVGSLLEESFPDLRGKPSVYKHFLADLQARGLIESNPRSDALADLPWALLRFTPMGRAFLAFISEPQPRSAPVL